MTRTRFAVALGAAGGLVWALGCGNNGTKPPANRAPRIQTVGAQPPSVIKGGLSQVTALVSDPDGDAFTVHWSAPAGSFDDPSRTTTRWTAPDAAGSYMLHLLASDGALADSDSVMVTVGNAALTVVSEPGGAYITLDGVGTGKQTPWTFDPIAPGSHRATLFSPYFSYPIVSPVDLADGEKDTLRFLQPPATVVSLDLGRTDLLEIGGVAFLPTGDGYLYAARTATGTAVYSAGGFQSSGYGRTALVVSGVRIQEPIAIEGGFPYLFFVSDTDSLCSVYVDDRNRDGIVDSVGTVVRLRPNTYAPATSGSGQIAFALGPSEGPPLSQLRWAQLVDGTITSTPNLASTGLGSTPTWKPGDTRIAFARSGVLFTSYLDPNSLPTTDTLVTEGYDASPAWSPWGPKLVAYLEGADAGSLAELHLVAPGTRTWVSVLDGLRDPRYITWSPYTQAVVVTVNPPGNPQALYVREMPIP